MSPLPYDAHDAIVAADRLSRNLARAVRVANAVALPYDDADWAAYAMAHARGAVAYSRTTSGAHPDDARRLALYAGEVAANLPSIPTGDEAATRKLTLVAGDISRDVEALCYLTNVARGLS